MSSSSEHSHKTGRESRKKLHPDQFHFLPPMLAASIRLLHQTCDLTVIGEEHEREALSHGRSMLRTCWHFTYPTVVYHFRHRNGMLMVSRSRDGEWIARILKYLGYETARGSPGKGGGVALRQMVAHIRSGKPVGLIADGSQGPALEAQKGILILARHANAPLVPLSLACDSCWRLKTWDRTLIPKPFSRIVMAFGSPIWIPKESSSEDLETYRLELQTKLLELTRECEAALGLTQP